MDLLYLIHCKTVESLYKIYLYCQTARVVKHFHHLHIPGIHQAHVRLSTILQRKLYCAANFKCLLD